MRKELLVYVSTNEEGEEVKVQRVAGDPNFYLFTLGSNRMVLNVEELLEAISNIDKYSTMFDQEAKMKEMRNKSQALKVVPITPNSVTTPNEEEEGTIMMESVMRTEPTDSEKALEEMTKHMQGESLVMTEKKET